MKDKKARLDQFVVDIEFLLISVIQGVALGALATNATEIIKIFQFEYWLYIVSGFLFILNFWSQAIIHTLSFIDWPLDMTHNFLYFLVSLIEVMAFSQLMNPLGWFTFISLFFVLAYCLYWFDLSLIKKHKEKFQETDSRKKLYDHIIKRELFEFKALLPLGLLFNILAALFIFLNPNLFIKNNFHIFLIFFQALFGLGVLIDSVKNFKKRSQLISQASY